MNKMTVVVMAAVALAMSAVAEDFVSKAKDFDPSPDWKTVDGALVAERQGASVSAVLPIAAGGFDVWAEVLVGSKVKIDVNGSVYVPKAEGTAGEFVWEKLGAIGGVPGGYTAVTVTPTAEGKSAFRQVLLTDDLNWKAPVPAKPAAPKCDGKCCPLAK